MADKKQKGPSGVFWIAEISGQLGDEARRAVDRNSQKYKNQNR